MVTVDWVLLRVSKLSGSRVGTTVLLRVDSRSGWVVDRIGRKPSA